MEETASMTGRLWDLQDKEQLRTSNEGSFGETAFSCPKIAAGLQMISVWAKIATNLYRFGTCTGSEAALWQQCGKHFCLPYPFTVPLHCRLSYSKLVMPTETLCLAMHPMLCCALSTQQSNKKCPSTSWALSNPRLRSRLKAVEGVEVGCTFFFYCKCSQTLWNLEVWSKFAKHAITLFRFVIKAWVTTISKKTDWAGSIEANQPSNPILQEAKQGSMDKDERKEHCWVAWISAVSQSTSTLATNSVSGFGWFCCSKRTFHSALRIGLL